MVSYFHYHLKCRHTYDKKGAIEVDLFKSIRKTVYHCYYLKWHQINVNRRNFYLGCKNVRKLSYIFINTSNVGIFRTKKVILKLIFWNQVGRLFMIATIWNGIKLMWIDGICILVAKISQNGLIFSLSPQMSAYSWQKRCYWSWSFEIKLDDFLSLQVFELASN